MLCNIILYYVILYYVILNYVILYYIHLFHIFKYSLTVFMYIYIRAMPWLFSYTYIQWGR